MQQPVKKIHNESSANEVDFAKVREDFPQLTETKVHGKPLIYLDSAATTLKPRSVVSVIDEFYQYQMANIHRGVHYLSEQGTTRYEGTRIQIQEFLGAADRSEIIFTSGTTASINLVAYSYGRVFLKKGDEIIISEMEHHSNIVPWQILCEEKGCVLKVIPMNDAGELIYEEYERLLSEKTKIVAVVYISNSLGTVNPVKKIIDAAHKHGAVTVIDAAQAVAYTEINVQGLDCDFLAFSGHKIFGPTGIGVLYGKKDLLDKMPPFLSGGDMIDVVTFEKTTYNDLPQKFEAGTPHIAGVIGLSPAISYVQELGFDAIRAHGSEILEYATKKILEIDGVKILGTAKDKGAILTFIIDGAHSSDIGTLIDMEGVAIRTGHHCTQPVMQHFGVFASARASFSIYNNKEDVDVFMAALKKVKEML